MITKIDIKLSNGTSVTLDYDEAKEVYEEFEEYEIKNNSINSTNLVTIWSELGMFMDGHS